MKIMYRLTLYNTISVTALICGLINRSLITYRNCGFSDSTDYPHLCSMTEPRPKKRCRCVAFRELPVISRKEVRVTTDRA